MAQPELNELTRALKEIVFIEREVESAKIELALKSDFNLYDMFTQLDFDGTGRVDKEALRNGLELNLGFRDFMQDDLYLFFRRFAAGGDLNFNSMSHAILPFSREYALLVTDRPEYYCKREREARRFFQVDTRYELLALWTIIFKAERQLVLIRVRLANNKYLNLEDAFDYCSRSRKGQILAGDLRDIMAESGFYSTERELQGLMYRLDANKDAAVSIHEFIDTLTPKLN